MEEKGWRHNPGVPSLRQPGRERIYSIKLCYAGLGEQLPLFTSPSDSLQRGWSQPGRGVPLCCLFVPSKAQWHGTGDRNCFFYGGHGDLLYSGGRRGWWAELGQQGFPQSTGGCAAVRWPPALMLAMGEGKTSVASPGTKGENAVRVCPGLRF